MAKSVSELAYFDEQGFHLADFEDFLTFNRYAFARIYGTDVYLDPDSQDAQLITHFAQAQYRVKAGAAHTVVQRTVHGGKGNAYRKSELAHAFILLANLFTDDSRQIIHCLPSFTQTFSVVQFPILGN